MVWQRPADAEFPRVYRRFELTRGGGVERYELQDLPPEHDDAAVELMVNRFMLDEPTCKSTDAHSDPNNRTEMREYWQKCVKDRTSLALYQLQGDCRRLVGLNMCGVSEAGDPKTDISQLKGAAWRQILHTIVLATETCDVFRALGVTRYLGGSGLLVLPELRGRGLAAEIVNAREPLCRAVGIPATATVFTALASQKVAERCGFRLLGELPYSELSVHGYNYPDIESPSAKLMGKRYDGV